MKKQTKDMSLPEINLQEVFELLEALKQELQEIKAVADVTFMKVNMSHSLIVVRKIGEDKLEELKDILD